MTDEQIIRRFIVAFFSFAAGAMCTGAAAANDNTGWAVICAIWAVLSVAWIISLIFRVSE
jgi:uncharacterized membrane protein YoaK (UPF0700 family)